MQAPGGPEEDTESEFSHGGWSMAYWDGFMAEVMATEMAVPREVLLGRKTYEAFAAYWPAHRDQPGAKELNGATKYVASRTLRTLDWENSRLLEGDVASAVSALKSTDGPDLQVIGSSNLLRTLFRADLVDHAELWIFPVVLGRGKRFFSEGVPPGAWQLIDHRSSTTGVQLLRYQRAGPIVSGPMPSA